MKKKLFGQLGEKLKGNGLTVTLGVCVILAGLFSYNTIKNINKQLENQRLQKIEVTPSPIPEDKTQDVQKEQENVPLPTNPTPKSKKTPEPEKEAEVKPEPEKKRFILPIDGKIFAKFSGDELVYNRTMDDWRTHNGVDIRAMRDDPVKSGADGTVQKIYTDGLLGVVIEIDHGEFVARYCGLDAKTFVKEGDKVTQGQNIGKIGEIDMEINEEPHSHLEILKDGKYTDPEKILK